jgi:hypothetical protein
LPERAGGRSEVAGRKPAGRESVKRARSPKKAILMKSTVDIRRPDRSMLHCCFDQILAMARHTQEYRYSALSGSISSVSEHKIGGRRPADRKEVIGR